MKIGIIGRTKILIDVAKKLLDYGFEIPFIYTYKAEAFYNYSENDYLDFANSIQADYYCDSSINSMERIHQLQAYSCDVAFSLNWISLLKEEICSAFKHGIYNAHAGDLPRYRGNACPNWAILNNEKSIGLTIHQIEPSSLDSGDIVAKEFLPITENTYISDVYTWIENRIPDMYLTVAQQILAKTLHKEKQDSHPAYLLRCYPRKPEDAKINWDQSSELIHRLIRASSSPFCGAFTYLETGELIRIWKAELVDHHGSFCAVPGQILYADEGFPVIACKNSVIKLTEVTTENNDLDAKKLILRSLRNRLM